METNKTGKCQNCKEQDCELLEVETEKGKEMWCDACLIGRDLDDAQIKLWLNK